MNVGHIWRIKDGREEEYDGRHATIWPELESLFHRLGVREYHIYRRGSTVVSHLEVDDYAALKREYGLDPVATRWEQHFGDILEYPNADAEGWPEELHHVWSLPDRRGDGCDDVEQGPQQ